MFGLTKDKDFSVIEYQGDNSVFIYKSPVVDFLTGSTLIVHESQEALFFMNGEALDLFGPGRHILTTQNLPLLARLFSKSTGGKEQFRSEIYFINKTEQMGILWGTDSQAEYMDPQYRFPIKLGARGEMSLTVSDPRKLIIKVVGTETELTNQQFTKKIRGLTMPYIKKELVTYISSHGLSVFDLDSQLVDIQEGMKALLDPIFENYGVELAQFALTAIMKPEDDPQYLKFRELHYRRVTEIEEERINAEKVRIRAQGAADKRRIEGYTYQDERGFDVAERLAGNEGGAGQLGSLGAGLGMMMGVAGPMGTAVGNAVSSTMSQQQPQSAAAPAQTEKKHFCMNCGAEITPNAKFCPECGNPVKAKEGVCPGCGKEVPEGAKFCPECGTKIE